MTSISCNTLYCVNALCTKVNEVGHGLQKIGGEHKECSTRYFWADAYRCPSCNAIFYNCKLCADKGRKQHLYLRSRLYRHNHLHKSDGIESH